MTMKKLLLASAVASALAAPAAAFAQAAPAAPAKPSAPSFGDILDAAGITVTGYIDASYEYLSGNGSFTSGTPDRVFDTEHSSFLLNQAAITVAKQPKEGFGGLVNLTAGHDANIIAPFDANQVGSPATSNFDVTQGYVQYASGPLTLIAGKFVTAAGAETINPTTDVNYSRSILFGYAIPFTHTGVRATYAGSDTFTIFGGLNNGWDDLKDTNTQKTGELGVSVTPTKALTINVVDYYGTEQVGGLTKAQPSGSRNVFDLVAIWTATDKMTFTLNYDYGTQDNATKPTDGSTVNARWSGYALYGAFQLNDQWRLAVRGEYFNDQDGYRTGVVQKWKEGTLTLAYLPTKNVELRGEVRYDWSDQSSFLKPNGIDSSKNQSSLGFEAIYKF
jgi:hypothetical protein